MDIMIGLVIAIIGVAWVGLCLAFGPSLYRRWREPVLRRPVFILESDDWGAGPVEQAVVLEKLHALLLRFQDSTGRHPAMTIGLILAIADTDRIRGSAGKFYHSTDLASPRFADVREQLLTGEKDGVFALQLHGKEHYWPDSVLRAASSNAEVQGWLTGEGIPQTESLPSHLQARWTEASALPSRAHTREVIASAVQEEIKLFEASLDRHPHVAVATTFVWNEDVEHAWAAHGIDTIITPGRRYTLRDAQGRPGGVDKIIENGDLGADGQIYLVRDVYFEPALGHEPQRLINDSVKRSRLGRPILVEMHRFNFMGGEQRVSNSIKALEDGMVGVLGALPDVRFLSSAELAKVLRRRDPAFVENGAAPRLKVWLRRVDEMQAFNKLASASGLGVVLWLFRKVLRA